MTAAAIGARFGALVVLATVASDRRGTFVRCRCDCGAEVERSLANLRRGFQLSCGCVPARSASKLYGIWRQIVQRCTNPRVPSFAAYGAAGVTICREWRISFDRFAADVGPRPSPWHSIDRIDPAGNYAPGNVRWATPREQARNQRRTLRVVVGGVRRAAIDVAEEHGVKRIAFHMRVRAGWSLLAAATTPPLRQRAA